jgi:phage baseplate assembly protein W
MMQDASLVWGADLSVSSTGDIALASATTLGQQRVLRRLLTNPGDYIWQLDYGAGLARFVGTPIDVLAVRAAIRSQIFKESAVSRTPEPFIDVQTAQDGSVIVQIRYVDSTLGTTQVLSFQVGG